MLVIMAVSQGLSHCWHTGEMGGNGSDTFILLNEWMTYPFPPSCHIVCLGHESALEAYTVHYHTSFG